MKMNEPFNSQAPHFLTRVKAYCAKVLPLVFDNSLSYYEFLGKVCHKLNECIDALNAQNLNIIEFTHMVQLEMENFEKYIDTRMTDFENGIKTEWAQYKEEMNQAFNDFKTQIETEWAAEKAINEKFRNDLLNDFNAFKNEITAEQTRFENQIKADFNTFKESVNTEIEQFEQTTNADLSAFKNTMQTQQNEFEDHMVELFNNFKTTEKKARTDFESNFQQLFEQWKIDTLNALNKSISDWETETNTALMSAIEEKIGGYVTTFNAQLNQLSLDLNAEREDRRQHDESLQNQINQLTPTGSIKADTADSDGNSQLYIINPDTQERTNIFPKTNNSGGGIPENVVTAGAKNARGVCELSANGNTFLPKGELTPVYLTPNTDTNTSRLKPIGGGRGIMQHYLLAADGTGIIKLKGTTDLGAGFIKIPIAELGLSTVPGRDGKEILSKLQIDFEIYAEGTIRDNIAESGLKFNLHDAIFVGNDWYCGVTCTGFSAAESLITTTDARLITKINLFNY